MIFVHFLTNKATADDKAEENDDNDEPKVCATLGHDSTHFSPSCFCKSQRERFGFSRFSIQILDYERHMSFFTIWLCTQTYLLHVWLLHKNVNIFHGHNWNLVILNNISFQCLINEIQVLTGSFTIFLKFDSNFCDITIIYTCQEKTSSKLAWEIVSHVAPGTISVFSFGDPVVGPSGLVKRFFAVCNRVKGVLNLQSFCWLFFQQLGKGKSSSI